MTDTGSGATAQPSNSGIATGVGQFNVEQLNVGEFNVEQLNYEQARDELIRVVQQLEAGTQSLEASISLWERGEALAARCESWLVGARERLERAKRDIES